MLKRVTSLREHREGVFARAKSDAGEPLMFRMSQECFMQDAVRLRALHEWRAALVGENGGAFAISINRCMAMR